MTSRGWRRLRIGSGVLAGAALVLAGAAWFAIERGMFELPIAELRERYALPDSRWMTIDGTRLHYIDRGGGSAVLLLHASFMNLRTWDSLSDALDGHHRVVRMDMLGTGLTEAVPAETISLERNVELLRVLLDRLGIGRAAIVGTSTGGIIAFRFAARYPERVQRLILINSAGMPRTARTDPSRARGSRFAQWLDARFRPRSFWERTVGENFPSAADPSAPFITMVHDMNRREGWRADAAELMANFASADPEAVLARVTAPTHILWGKENPTVMHLEADVFAHWLVCAPTRVLKYDRLGHYPYIEDPAVLETDIAAILRGERDDGMRPPAHCRSAAMR